MSFEMEFKSQESTTQSAFYHLGYYEESVFGGVYVPSMKRSLVFAPKSILTDRLHDKKLFPVNGVETRIIPG